MHSNTDTCRYLYCDDVSLEADIVLPTIDAAQKYIMPHLEQVCVEYLVTNVDASNACLLLNRSRILKAPELTQRCLDVIDFKTEESLQSDSFTAIDYQTLKQILDRDTLCAEETVVFAAASRWAEAECSRQGRYVDPQQRREVLGDALYLLRVPTMTEKEFAEIAVESGLLSKEEIIDIFLFFDAENKPALQFPTIHRRGTYLTCSRFNRQNTHWGFDIAKRNSIRFSVDKAIFVTGFGQYGANVAAEYNVDMALTLKKGKENVVLSQKKYKMSVDGSSNTTRVLFDWPVRIEAGTLYTASFDVDYNGEGHHGESGMSHVRCHDINFNFMHNSADNNFTIVASGQIPEIIFYRWPQASHVLTINLSHLMSLATSWHIYNIAILIAHEDLRIFIVLQTFIGWITVFWVLK